MTYVKIPLIDIRDLYQGHSVQTAGIVTRNAGGKLPREMLGGTENVPLLPGYDSPTDVAKANSFFYLQPRIKGDMVRLAEQLDKLHTLAGTEVDPQTAKDLKKDLYAFAGSALDTCILARVALKRDKEVKKMGKALGLTKKEIDYLESWTKPLEIGALYLGAVVNLLENPLD